MSTPQEDFQRDPYDFLSNNVVYPSINVLRQEYLLPDVGGEAFVIRPAPVIPVTVKKVPNANSTTGDVFALVRAGDKAPFPLRAYYMSDGGGGSAPAKISATTFGKRSGDKWEFFVLRFTSKKAGDNQFARDYLHKGIIGATS